MMTHLDMLTAHLTEETGAPPAVCRAALIEWKLTTAADTTGPAARRQLDRLTVALHAAVLLDQTQVPLPGPVGEVRQTATPAARFELPQADPADFELTAQAAHPAQRGLFD